MQFYNVVGIIAFKGSLEEANKNTKSLLKLPLKLQDSTQVKNVLLFNDTAKLVDSEFGEGFVIEALEVQLSGQVLLSTPR